MMLSRFHAIKVLDGQHVDVCGVDDVGCFFLTCGFLVYQLV